jgi:hypothetical protein
VDSVCVIIRDVIPDQTAQMNVIENDQVIEKLSATVSDPAFRDSILPWACRAYAHGFYSVRCQHIGDLLAKLGITIPDRVAVRTGFRKCFSQLLPVGCGPTAVEMVRYADEVGRADYSPGDFVEDVKRAHRGQHVGSRRPLARRHPGIRDWIDSIGHKRLPTAGGPTDESFTSCCTCPYHRRILRQACPHCERQIGPLDPRCR